MSPAYLGHNLIFIISQPRSGSTLLQRVLAGHPDIQTSAETWLMLHPVYARKPDKIDVEYDSEWAATAVNEFLDHYTEGGGDVLDNAIRAWAEVMYTAALNHGHKRIFLDKTPRYFFIIPELYRLFPEAKFIFLLRNPLAVLASELSTYVGEDWTVLGLFKPDLVDAPQMILDGIQLLGEDAIRVNYEHFVSNPEEGLRALCSALGIEFHASMLSYGDTPAPIGKMNDPVGIHKHSQPSTASLDKWKRLKENPQHLHFAQSYLRDLGPEIINRMGYEYDELHSELHQTRVNTRKLFPWELALRSQERLKLEERIFVNYYFMKARHGPIKGTMALLQKAVSHVFGGRRLVTGG